ncbi:MAG: hypothetical protein ACRC33_20550, partial [Gemmataceae bacterium]
DGLTVEVPPRMPAAGEGAAGRLERMSVAGMTAADAPGLHYRGTALFFRGEYDGAARLLLGAATLDPKDARTWAYLALAERERGDAAAAARARAEAARLYRSGLPKANEVGRALERVQGPARAWLREGLDAAR